MSATSAVINDGALWASAPLFVAAHLWSWHPFWAAGIWTAYGIGALFPQGEALLSQMAGSPLHYNFNPLHSRLCGLNYGSVIFEVPTNSKKDQETNVLVTPVASTSDLEHTTHAGEQDKLISVVTVNATRVNDQLGLVSRSQRSASDGSRGHIEFSLLSIPDSSTSLTYDIMSQISSSSPVLSQIHSSERSSLTSSPLPSSEIMQPFTGTYLEMHDCSTPLAVGDRRSPPSFGWLRLSKSRLSLSFGDYEIRGCPARQWWPSLVMCCFNLFVFWYVYNILLWAYRKMVREPPPPTAAPSEVPAANTIIMVASEAAAPTPNQRTLGSIAQSTPANRDTTIRKYIQQRGQSLAHYWQAFKEAFTVRKIRCHIWTANLVWGGNHQPFVQILRVTAILVCCMILARPLLEGALGGLMRIVPKEMHQPVFATRLLTSRSTAFQAPDRIAGAISNCLCQTKQCTSSALQTRLSPDGSYPPFPASTSHTDVVCERILRTIMSYKMIRLAVSRTFLGELLRR